eukprot:CAMPEP_0181299158 /NCGR_PEP_ID=MMETSP1101-20121128/6184_1 /TAXON_ID=46948 /ORGANISM="Rhodomonas abbreviata, Strain Caron Lab Isolate" /LENGTH=337 /DNA_ID=CAMNT_0023404263 /DNA_START=269 /DNA_END=1278 /DNA_ORIENTATION=+
MTNLRGWSQHPCPSTLDAFHFLMEDGNISNVSPAHRLYEAERCRKGDAVAAAISAAFKLKLWQDPALHSAAARLDGAFAALRFLNMKDSKVQERKADTEEEERKGKALDDGDLQGAKKRVLDKELVLALMYVRQPSLIFQRDAHGRTAAHAAARHGQHKILDLLHSLSKDMFEARDRFGLCVAHTCAGRGHLEGITTIARLSPSLLSARNVEGGYPAHSAAISGHEHIIKFLHQQDPSLVSVRDGRGMTPAHMAALFGHEHVVRLLFELDSELLQTQDDEGERPVDLASSLPIREFLSSAQHSIHAILPRDLPLSTISASAVQARKLTSGRMQNKLR